MNIDWIQSRVLMTTGNGLDESCWLEYRLGKPVELIATSAVFGRMVFEAIDLFDALCKVRLEAERRGFLLLCNGARKDAYPSRMSRQMNGGRKIYVCVVGKQAKKEDLIDLFEPAGLGEVASVAEQKKNFQTWLDSLGSP